jgi:hypothetical protein
MMMPCGIPTSLSFLLVWAMISRRCASTSTPFRTAALDLMMAPAIRVFPDPVGATSMARVTPAATQRSNSAMTSR